MECMSKRKRATDEANVDGMSESECRDAFNQMLQDMTGSEVREAFKQTLQENMRRQRVEAPIDSTLPSYPVKEQPKDFKRKWGGTSASDGIFAEQKKFKGEPQRRAPTVPPVTLTSPVEGSPQLALDPPLAQSKQPPKPRIRVQIRNLCPHGNRQKSKCKFRSCCPHGKIKYSCKECGGSAICKHGRQKEYWGRVAEVPPK